MNRDDIIFVLAVSAIFAVLVYAKNRYIKRNEANKTVQLIFKIILPGIGVFVFSYLAFHDKFYLWFVVVALLIYHLPKEIRQWRSKFGDKS